MAIAGRRKAASAPPSESVGALGEMEDFTVSGTVNFIASGRLHRRRREQEVIIEVHGYQPCEKRAPSFSRAVALKQWPIVVTASYAQAE